MRKQKRLLTRKQKALRHCAWLVVILVSASVLRIYNFLPIQAIHYMADANDVENPVVIDSFYDGTLPITRLAFHHLVQGDNSLMFCATGWNLFMGWYDRTYATVEIWDGTGLYAGIYGHSQDEKRVTYFYGRVDAESVESLTLEVDFTYWNGQQEEKRYMRFEFGPEDFFEKNGTLYFCKKLDVESEWNWFAEPRMICVTGDGRTLETESVGWRSWST